MIKIIFFDNDCLSSFLWIKKVHLLNQLYPNCLQIPRSVYIELSKVNHLKLRVDKMVSLNTIEIIDIDSGTEEYETYTKLISGTIKRLPRIGRGEAAAITLAKHRGGILASNNLRDITFYIKEYSLPYLTTGEIMVQLVEASLVTINEAETMWSEMLKKRRKLPTKTFVEYQNKKNRNVIQ